MDERRRKRSRSRSPGPSSHRHRDRSPRRRNEAQRRSLPFSARELTKHDLHQYRPMFGLYLDIQKGHDIDELADHEVKGRWKSFIKKWNSRDLAEGWYDPKTLEKARQADKESSGTGAGRAEGGSTREDSLPPLTPLTEEATDEDDFGPALPVPLSDTGVVGSRGARLGPAVASVDDIRARNEDARTAAEVAREQRIEDRKDARKLERKLEKARLEEVAPRPEAGTRERQLEKKREIAASNRTFAAAKDAGGDVDLPENDVMGGDDLSDLKRKKQEEQKRKTEREVKREEILRARAAEREERSQRLRAKEEKTMSMLRELAQSRFGDGNVETATLGEER